MQQNLFGSRIDYKSEFESLWTKWRPFDMSKGSKKNAYESYLRINKLGYDMSKLESDALNYCAECGQRKVKTKHVSTWLNQYEPEAKQPANTPVTKEQQIQFAYVRKKIIESLGLDASRARLFLSEVKNIKNELPPDLQEFALQCSQAARMP